ncbi:hypothetical protein Pan241w_40490 [Gimesia alba]|uniref:Uncharacterized protein n=1 Tax=Gimesia alba TaxID=2527973 RepID=A0A517RJ94_9PLAN|nr:hypothetical protein [Gimesia alba]QDT43945.1 hypothetical protein Pan241w_40490 [Gimesia alba]
MRRQKLRYQLLPFVFLSITVGSDRHRMIRRDRVKLGCANLSPLIAYHISTYACDSVMMSCEASQSVGAQSEAVSVGRAKCGSNKGFLMMLFSTGCRYAKYFGSRLARDFISALSKSPPEGQDVKNALFPGHFLNFCEIIKGLLEYAMASVPLKPVAL